MKTMMNERLKEILKMIIKDYNLPVKRITPSNLDCEGTIMRYGTPHAILRYFMKNIGKTIYMEYDEYRSLARDVMVYDNI